MTNAMNVEFIVDKLLSVLGSAAAAADDHFRSDLVGQITQCAERFAPSNSWYDPRDDSTVSLLHCFPCDRSFDRFIVGFVVCGSMPASDTLFRFLF